MIGTTAVVGGEVAAGRVCARCGLWKPATEFYHVKKGASRLHTYCKPCCATRTRRQTTTVAEGRTCSRCGVWKPASEFCRDRGAKTGLFASCKSCQATKARDQYRAAPEIGRQEQRERYHADLAKSRQKQRDRYHVDQANPEHRKRRSLKSTALAVGITLDELLALYKAHDGRCDICRSTEPGSRRISRLHVDHSHQTGEVRGLLCAACNQGIAKFRDDPAILRRAAAYVERGS
jgi:hypothetical protein